MLCLYTFFKQNSSARVLKCFLTCQVKNGDWINWNLLVLRWACGILIYSILLNTLWYCTVCNYFLYSVFYFLFSPCLYVLHLIFHLPSSVSVSDCNYFLLFSFFVFLSVFLCCKSGRCVIPSGFTDLTLAFGLFFSRFDREKRLLFSLTLSGSLLFFHLILFSLFLSLLSQTFICFVSLL